MKTIPAHTETYIFPPNFFRDNPIKFLKKYLNCQKIRQS